MLDVHRHGGEQLGCQTIAATMVSIGGNFLAQGFGNVGTRHVCKLRLRGNLIAAPGQQQPGVGFAHRQPTVRIQQFL